MQPHKNEGERPLSMMTAGCKALSGQRALLKLLAIITVAISGQVVSAETTAQKFADGSPSTYFFSQETGRIRLIAYYGDRPNPFTRSIRTVHHELYDPSDENIFIHLANQHRPLRRAEIREQRSPFFYILRAVYVKGYEYERPRTSNSNVIIALGVADWIPCGHDRNRRFPC
jgi:hypothetical protein